MMGKFIVFSMVFLLLQAGYGENRTVSFVRIKFDKDNQKSLEQITDAVIDITHYNNREGFIEGFVDQSTLNNLSNKGYILEPLISDMASFAEQLRNENYFANFHSYPQMIEEMRQIVDEHPDIAMMQDIGDSYEKIVDRGGYDIWALKISDNVEIHEENEADVLYMAAIHAREIITPEVIFTFISYLINNYNSDPYVTHLIHNREIWLIPCVNPDGHEYVFTGDINSSSYYSDPIWWRKNKQDNNKSGIFEWEYDGVDLNRNFGYMWGIDDYGSDPEPKNDTYRGVEKFSEPESQVIRDFVGQHNFVISLMYHSYGRLWLYPWEYTDENLSEPDLSAFLALADSCVAYNGYKPGNNATGTIYKVNGGTDDWLYGEHGIFAFSPEVGSEEQGAFWPDTSLIDILTGENLGPNLFMAYAAGEEPIVENQSFKDINIPAKQYTITASIKPPIPLTGAVPLDTSEFKVFYSYNHKDNFDSLLLNYLPSVELFIAKIPGEDFVGTIYYYIQAKDSLGRTGTAPRGAPAALDSFAVAFPLHALNEDDFAPKGVTLTQNYPNPFNASTRIIFELPEKGFVNLSIYNRLGQKIKELTDGIVPPGQHKYIWDGTDEAGELVSTGVYFAVIKTGNKQLVEKMVYVR